MSANEKDEQAKAALMQVVGECQGADGATTPVTNLDCMSSQVRQMVTNTIRLLDPEGYAEYRKRKYANGDNPSLKDRKLAYNYAFTRFLHLTYTKAGI